MGSNYWLKLYHEMLDDPKVMTLRPALRWRFIETLLVAGEMDEAGYLPPVDKYAWRVRDNVEVVESQFAELADAGLLSKDNGRWLVTKFAERQAPVSAAERMRRMRERKRKREYYGDDTPDERGSYDDVTNRNAEKIREDTDKDIDEDARTHGGIAEGVDVGNPNGRQDPDRVAMETEMLSAISQVVKEVFVEHENAKRFYAVRDAFIEAGITPKQVRDFEDYWREADVYSGPPALTSLRNHIKASLSNGSQQETHGYQGDDMEAIYGEELEASD